MEKFCLNGEWKFKELGKIDWLSATVPGCNYLDLLKLKLIPDPFVGVNEKEVYWVANCDWEYRKEFEFPEKLMEEEKLELNCKCLDTVCDVYLNDILIGQGSNCHLEYNFDIKKAVVPNKNILKFIFYSPVKYVKKKQALEKCPNNCNGQTGIPHIRKPQCHFGWDWGPVLPPSGISGDINIVGYSTANIVDLEIKQKHFDDFVELEISAGINVFGEGNIEYTLNVKYPDGKELDRRGVINNSIKEEIKIEKPQLWWTKELSGNNLQPLYTVNFQIFKNKTLLDSKTKKIGLRTIILNREKDEYGSNFQFKLNGVSLFIKGANWIPADSFITRYSKQRLEYDLKTALFSNMNMLRIWGGGYYESDMMYDLCDEYGILLWQDFPFACQAYPFFDEELLQNVLKEVEYNVKRLRHHACLAVWSGNNEIEAMSMGWMLRKQYIDWTEKFFYDILPNNLIKYDNITPYIPGSPCGVSHLKGHDRDNVGDTHLWAVWHGLQPMTYYRKRLTRFCSEFGFESLPDIKTIEKYAEKKDYSLTSEVFTAHQKCNSGNMKMAYYIASRFRLPKNFTDYIYLSQICQQECIKDATEHWRRNKGRCNGAMYWQMNDCWPVCSWAGMDYYGNYKALQYTSKHFNAPIMISIENKENDIDIYAINDTMKTIKCIVKYTLIDFNGKQLEVKSEELVLSMIANSLIFKIKINDIKKRCDLKQIVLVAELFSDGKLINQKTYLFDKEKNLKLPKADICKEITISGETIFISLKSKNYVRLLQICSKTNSLPFSDNYFDLIPGETRIITQQIGNIVKLEELKEDIVLFSACEIEPKGSKLSDFIKKTKILLKPVNFGGYLFHKKIPKDIEV